MKTLRRILATFLAVSAFFTVGCGHQHSYGEQVMQATCAQDGKKFYTCECGDTYEEVIPATGEHNFVDYTCTVCGESQYDFITVAKALELCGEEAGYVSTEKYYIRATVVSVLKPQFGNMIISDGTGQITVYGIDGYSTMTEKPYKGDEVVLHCVLQNFNGTKEIKSSTLVDFKTNAPTVDENSYMEMSVAQARAAAKGTKVKVDGVVAKIAYASGKTPCGVYLVDETQSIYVYDRDLAGRVQIGNKVTIAATKTYWVLEKEQTNAAKFGYQGCNQLEEVTLLENDNGNHEFDTSWIQESTVKEILETPVTEDITTTIYKVNALVKKAVGDGYVNYYFDDLDGVTGTYTYTQCDGADFAWLDEFDGKICTVYLSPINAKSTATSCGFRFFPVKVVDENFTFDKAKAGEFAVKYYGVDQFSKEYYSDPQKALVTSVSSELLGFENATLSYSSSNEESAYFETVEGVTYLRCATNGKVTITVTGSYGEYEAYTQTVEIEVLDPDQFDTITVARAITATDGSEVLVRGIVGPSVVNKDGFYLFGEDGSMISVIMKTTDEFKNLEIGNEVILKGERERYVNDDSAAWAGQTSIINAEIVVNIYGNTEYSTANAEEKTLAELYALDYTIDYSTKVFVVKCKVGLSTGYPNVQLQAVEGSDVFNLYQGSSAQYDWLLAYQGQEVTLEVAVCNWNNKKYWRGCVLAVRLEDGTKVYNTLNFDRF